VLRILRLALPLALAGCCSQSALVDEVFLIRNPDPDTQALIATCRAPAQPDCVPLCDKLTGKTDGVFEHCEMHPDRDGYMQVHVGYYERLPACL
jgi:hypothetical protein